MPKIWSWDLHFKSRSFSLHLTVVWRWRENPRRGPRCIIGAYSTISSVTTILLINLCPPPVLGHQPFLVSWSRIHPIYGTGTLWWRCMPASRILLSRIHQGGCQSPDTPDSDQIWHQPDIYKYSASASHLKWMKRDGYIYGPFLLLINRKWNTFLVFDILCRHWGSGDGPESMGWNNNLIH